MQILRIWNARRVITSNWERCGKVCLKVFHSSKKLSYINIILLFEIKNLIMGLFLVVVMHDVLTRTRQYRTGGHHV